MGTCQVSCEGQCEVFGKLLKDSLLTTTVTGEALDEPVVTNVCVCMCWSESHLPVVIQLPSTFQLCREKDESV